MLSTLRMVEVSRLLLCLLLLLWLLLLHLVVLAGTRVEWMLLVSVHRKVVNCVVCYVVLRRLMEHRWSVLVGHLIVLR